MNYGKVIEIQTAYIHGYLEAKIENFAESAGISSSELTKRLGALFLGTTNWELLGTEDRVSKLSRKTTKRNKTTRKMTMARSTSGITSYWNKMTPAQRKAEVKRRRKVALAKKAGA